jgi:hypothetical protein
MAPYAAAIVGLDRKIAHAIQTQRGIILKPADLDVLTLVGALDMLEEARSALMKEIAHCRHQANSTADATIILTDHAAPTDRSPAPTALSSGPTQQPAAHSSATRARLIFG